MTGKGLLYLLLILLVLSRCPTYAFLRANNYLKQNKPNTKLRKTPPIIICMGTADMSYPIKRQFVPISAAQRVAKAAATASRPSPLRVLQFNILADGLSGLRSDLGAFSRAQAQDVQWQRRGRALLQEITQYQPDVITLQECDHYYDWFLPALNCEGYDGVFAPKPASACLEVSPNSDGCALFFKRDRIRAASAETITYALQMEGDPITRVQNQVAIISVLEVKSEGPSAAMSRNPNPNPSPCSWLPIVVATTHLKASKTGVGESYRHKEAQQLLGAIDLCVRKVAQYSEHEPAVVLTGDLNASPDSKSSMFGYESSVYPMIKQHSLGFRSVLNDDLQSVLEKSVDRVSSASEAAPTSKSPVVWTTWKARNKKGVEQVVKHCIDYVLYSTKGVAVSGSDTTANSAQVEVSSAKKVAIEAVGTAALFTDEEVGNDLFPSDRYPSDHTALIVDFLVHDDQTNS